MRISVRRVKQTVWDLETRKIFHIVEGLRQRSSIIVCSPAGPYFAFQSRDFGLVILHYGKGIWWKTPRYHSSDVTAAVFSKDGRFLASASAGQIIVWEVSTGREIQNLKYDEITIHNLSFSADWTYFETDRGEVEIDILAMSSPKHSSNGRNHWRIGVDWVLEGDRKMLWLPPHYYSGMILCHNGHIAMLNIYGHLTFWKLTLEKKLTE